MWCGWGSAAFPGSATAAQAETGLETLLPALYTETVARLLSEGQARHFCLYPGKGALQPGADADLAILEREPTKFEASKTQTAADWSPYDGKIFAGRVARTYVRGQMVWDGRKIVVAEGYGRFVRPANSGVGR